MPQRAELDEWFEHGKEHGATHMIIVFNVFDGKDTPVYVIPPQHPREVVEDYRTRSMRQVMEVYALHLDKASQIAEHRAFHYESP